MLYDAVVHVKLPGDDPADAARRLALALRYRHEVVELTPAAEQPPRIVGEANIKMPLPAAFA